MRGSRRPRGLAAALVIVAVAGMLPRARAQNEQAFFDLYKSWRTQQAADFNLDGRVNYWDALCLTFEWAHLNCHRFYISAAPVNVLAASSENTTGLPLNTIIIQYPVVAHVDDPLGTPDSPANFHFESQPIRLLDLDLKGPVGAPLDFFVGSPPVDVRFATSEKALSKVQRPDPGNVTVTDEQR